MDDQWRRGYPIDQRTAQQRGKAFQDHVSPDFEYQVGRVLARFTGARVRLQDDGSTQQMPDISLEYADGRVGFAEVWMALDSKHAEVAGALSREPDLSTSGLSRDWTVRVSRDFRLKKDGRSFRQWVPTLLAEFEAAGQVYEFVPSPHNLAVHAGPLADRAAALGIWGLASRPAQQDSGGVVRFVPWGAGGLAMVDWDAFHTWVDAEVNADTRHMRGNREKLSRAGGDESHAVIGVTMTTPWPAQRALASDSQLPSKEPLLPREFTHLWLIGAQISDRCLAWYPHLGWFDPTDHWATE